MSAGKLQLAPITDGLNTCRVGRRVEIHDTVDSTNGLARERIAEGDGDGLVIFAEYQSAGRGRLGRRWESPRGASVMMSLVLSGARSHPGGEALALLTAVAAVDAIQSASGVLAEIKWPNDLVVGDRKLGGVLVESRLSHRLGRPSATLCGGTSEEISRNSLPSDVRAEDGAPADRQTPNAYIVGIGVNCLQHRDHFPESLRATATSLELESPEPVERNQVARHLLIELDRWLAEPRSWDARALRDAWIQRALPLGRRIRLRQRGREFSGHVLDISPAAGLVVQLDRGGRRLFDASSSSVVD